MSWTWAIIKTVLLTFCLIFSLDYLKETFGIISAIPFNIIITMTVLAYIYYMFTDLEKKDRREMEKRIGI